MGRYDPNMVAGDTGPGWKIHPVWRGIGCIMIFLLPAMSYAGAVELVKANFQHGWFGIPIELTGPPQYPYLFAYLLIGILLLIASLSILVTIYSFIYRSAAGSRLGPLDAPPERLQKRKKYK